MRKVHLLPTKVVDDFFEIPSVWRHFALKQTFGRDPQYATWAGERTNTLDMLDIKVFHSFASKLITHIPGCNYFKSLQANFALVDETYGQGWIHNDEPKWNVAGVIYLTPNPAPNSGTLFFNKIADTDRDFNEVFFKEINAEPRDRKSLQKYKTEQRRLYRKTMTVGNVYNRMVMFHPSAWHCADTYFGNTLDTSRLTLNFFGYAE
jgi:hypothetical protein